MNILATIEEAIKLFGEASSILEKLQPSIDGLKAGESATLAEAQARLGEAMDRAYGAHDDLENAIQDQLDKEEN